MPIPSPPIRLVKIKGKIMFKENELILKENAPNGCPRIEGFVNGIPLDSDDSSFGTAKHLNEKDTVRRIFGCTGVVVAKPFDSKVGLPAYSEKGFVKGELVEPCGNCLLRQENGYFDATNGKRM